jgi:hypothetical protein
MTKLYPRTVKGFALVAFALSSALSSSAQCPSNSTALGNGNNQTITSGQVVCLGSGTFNKNITIAPGAQLFIASGATFTGTITIQSGGQVIVMTGSTWTPATLTNNGTLTFGNTPLPIILQNFSATANGSAAILSWSTASELNGKSMIVQHSVDGVNFEDIKTVASSTNSTLVQNYSYTDYNASNGVNYYRLKLVSSDAPASYSAVVVVKVNSAASSSVAVYPTAFTDHFTVKLNEVKSGNVVVKLYNDQGVVVLVQTLSGSATQIINTPSNLATGLYILEVYNGTDKSYSRLMKL